MSKLSERLGRIVYLRFNLVSGCYTEGVNAGYCNVGVSTVLMKLLWVGVSRLDWRYMHAAFWVVAALFRCALRILLLSIHRGDCTLGALEIMPNKLNVEKSKEETDLKQEHSMTLNVSCVSAAR